MDYWFKCCRHCGCTTPEEMIGHDDTCLDGCNDSEMES